MRGILTFAAHFMTSLAALPYFLKFGTPLLEDNGFLINEKNYYFHAESKALYRNRNLLSSPGYHLALYLKPAS
jgi:hypothetical protein